VGTIINTKSILTRTFKTHRKYKKQYRQTYNIKKITDEQWLIFKQNTDINFQHNNKDSNQNQLSNDLNKQWNILKTSVLEAAKKFPTKKLGSTFVHSKKESIYFKAR